MLASGSLTGQPAAGGQDRYVYDPRDTSGAELESSLDPLSLTDQTLVYARGGRQLVYHTAPFAEATEISGFFRLSAWIAIDQPDTDFMVSVHEIRPDGASIPLATKSVADKSLADARPVLVRLYHDRTHPSVLHVPIGQPDPSSTSDQGGHAATQGNR